jgi:hypothetical protein
MAALAVAYRAAFASTSFFFVSLSSSFYSLFAGGFNQAQLPHATADARPIITLFSLLWPILFLVFVSGYVAVLSEEWARVNKAAAGTWSAGVISNLQEALVWATEPGVAELARFLRCGCCRAGKGEGAVELWWSRRLPRREERVSLGGGGGATAGERGGGGGGGCSACCRGFRSGALLAAVGLAPGAPLRQRIEPRVRYLGLVLGQGLPVLLLAVCFVLRRVAELLFLVRRCARCKQGAPAAQTPLPQEQAPAAAPPPQQLREPTNGKELRALVRAIVASREKFDGLWQLEAFLAHVHFVSGPGVDEGKKAKLCRFVGAPGGCRRGAQCPYLHPEYVFL